MASKWLMQDWEELFPALEQAITEERVKEICEAEIQGWRDRPGMKKESSLRVPMTDTRNEIPKRLQGEQQVLALKYLNFSEEWYREHNAPSQEKLDQNMRNQKLIRDPDAVVAKAVELFNSDRWQDVAVALAAVTGRRLAEVLQVGVFKPKSMYSVMFSGQLKRRDEETPAFEIPTLCPANLVLIEVARLRQMLEVQDMDTRTVSQKYGHFAQDAANRHFGDLLDGRDEDKKENLYSHLFRSVYARIAVFWFCPPTVTDMHFMATIQGHYELLQSTDDTFKNNYASSAHYYDYKIADKDGNVDGRQGLKLGAEGVELLETYKPKSRRKEDMAKKDTTVEKVPGKNYPVTVDGATFNRVQALRNRLNQTKYAETINFLMDELERKEAQVAHAPVSPDALAPDEETAAAIKKAMAISGQDFPTFLAEALSKEANFKIGLSTRHANKDFSKLTTKELTNTKHPEATKERIRRAIIAIAKYNDQAASPNDRWFINGSSVHKLIGGRFGIINEYFAEHEAEIKAENDEHELIPAYNRKAIGIERVITVPETVDQAPVLKLYETAE
jgi:hypothetical protein